jgi:hypothetical protein
MPRKKPIEHVRAICLALPEAAEVEAWGEPTFRVGGKIFAQYEDHHHGDPIIGLWLKAPEGMQRALVDAQPERFYVPKYVGPKGWVGVRMDAATDWAMVDDLVRQSYRLIAPKRLLSSLDVD